MNKMKVIYLTVLFASFNYLIGQTPVIASKAMFATELEGFSVDETFGLPSKSIDSFIRISVDSMVEYGRFFSITRDTMLIKDHSIFNDGNYNIDSIKAKYGHIKFINFEKFEKKKGKISKRKKRKDAPFLFLKLNSVFLKLIPFLALFLIMLIYNYRTLVFKFINK
ncbi:MAG TPA: hypothetical protein VGF79_03910 [Bacteroidia bacterium]